MTRSFYRRCGIIGGGLILATAISATVAYCNTSADAPAPGPKPSPSVRPAPVAAEPLPPVDVPGEPQPDSKVVIVPMPEQIPSPAPVLSPVAAANAESLSIESQVGAMVVTTSAETSLTPTLWADAEGPIALGEGRSLGRIGARIGLTGQPGQSSVDPSAILNYKGVEVGLRVGRVIGVLDRVRTAVLAEYAFTTLIKGSDQARPLSGLSHAGGVGLRFDDRDSNASLTVLFGFDESTTTCDIAAGVVCTGIHAGPAVIIYGQVPILDGRLLFAGDVSIAASLSGSNVTRHSVERVYAVVDPVQLFKKR